MRPALLLPVIALLSACGDVMYLEGSVNQLCQKLPAQNFKVPPLPGAVQLPPQVTLERHFDFDITAQLPTQLDRAQLTIALDRMSLTATQNVNLGFIQAAKVTLEPPPKSKLAPVVVVKDLDSSPSMLRFSGDDLELVPYLESGVLSYTVALTASTADMNAAMPENGLAADIDACANVSLRWDYAN